MADKILKHFLVLTRSHINGAIAEAGSIVGIHVDPDTWQPSPHLKEMEDYEPHHTEAQQKAADEAAERREESLAKREEREAAEDAPVEPNPEPELAMPPPAPPTVAPQENT